MGSLHDDLESHDAAKLLKHIARRVQEERPIVFLLGAGVNSPYVLGVDGVIEVIRQHYKEHGPDQLSLLDEKLNAPGVNKYQVAIDALSDDFTPDTVKRVVRCAVLHARVDQGSELVERARREGRRQECTKLEKDLANWKLTEGMVAFGKLLVEFPESFGRCVLTSNFDPCIEVGIRLAGGTALNVSLMADKEIEPPEQGICNVIHYHGHWFRSGTLHTPEQLNQPRQMLVESLREIIHESTIVVIGYSGWDDAFMKSLTDGAQSAKFEPDVLWTLYDDEVPETLVRSMERRFQQLRLNKRFRLYRGVDFNTVIPELLENMRAARGRTPEPEPPSVVDLPPWDTKARSSTEIACHNEPSHKPDASCRGEISSPRPTPSGLQALAEAVAEAEPNTNAPPKNETPDSTKSKPSIERLLSIENSPKAEPNNSAAIAERRPRAGTNVGCAVAATAGVLCLVLVGRYFPTGRTGPSPAASSSAVEEQRGMVQSTENVDVSPSQPVTAGSAPPSIEREPISNRVRTAPRDVSVKTHAGSSTRSPIVATSTSSSDSVASATADHSSGGAANSSGSSLGTGSLPKELLVPEPAASARTQLPKELLAPEGASPGTASYLRKDLLAPEAATNSSAKARREPVSRERFAPSPK